MSFLVFLSSFSYCGGEGGDGDVAKVVRVIVCEGEGEGQTVRRFAGAAGRGGGEGQRRGGGGAEEERRGGGGRGGGMKRVGAHLARLREDLHRLDARAHGEGVAAERARLVYG
jgi:hypothetical protein